MLQRKYRKSTVKRIMHFELEMSSPDLSKSIMSLNFVPTNINHLNRFGKEGHIKPLDIVVDKAEVFKADKNHEDSINILK